MWQGQAATAWIPPQDEMKHVSSTWIPWIYLTKFSQSHVVITDPVQIKKQHSLRQTH